MSSKDIYYVYVYKYPTTNTPFYVGYGKENRYLSHLNEASKDLTPVEGQHKLNSIRKIIREGNSPTIEFVDKGLTKEQACELEVFLISEIGRKDLGTGTLTNKTSGGDGKRGWSNKDKKNISLRLKNTISVINPITGDKFRVDKNDPRWLSGELIGQNYGKRGLNKTGKLTGYIQAKNPLTGETVRVKPTDPRWLSGELVGINKGIKAHPNTIAAANARKGIKKTPEHNKKVGESIKLLKWYYNSDTDKVGRFKEGEQPCGYIRVSGPHKKTPV